MNRGFSLKKSESSGLDAKMEKIKGGISNKGHILEKKNINVGSNFVWLRKDTVFP